ncbi:sulfate transporter family protein [uncultured Methylobacterium sp.]|uniref:sulfate transporter family protein n=1 Tax=uncultured Methylobacterium sp. TaxID=157278 RepID=UPI0035CC70A0
MLIQAALAALRQTFSPPLRAILWKSLGLTLGLLLLAWIGMTRLIQWFQASHHISEQYPLLDGLAYFLAGFGLFVALAYVMPAVSILVAGFFLDEAAAIVEGTDFPNEPPGRPMPWGTAMLYALRFAGLTLLVNLAALVVFFLPVVGIAAFFSANAYLLAREYFEMAAARFRPLAEANAMRRAHPATTLGAGCLLAGMMVVPVVNLLTPLFGIALMVHVHKGLSRRLPSPVARERIR